jgi:hypothetical protein
MMAHLRDLDLRCHYGTSCVKPARKQLFNAKNSPMGIFCAEHAKIRLKMLEREEKQEWKSSPTGSGEAE